MHYRGPVVSQMIFWGVTPPLPPYQPSNYAKNRLNLRVNGAQGGGRGGVTAKKIICDITGPVQCTFLGRFST